MSESTVFADALGRTSAPPLPGVRNDSGDRSLPPDMKLPRHAQVERWKGCGHMLMWDAPERVIAAALVLEGTSG